MQRPSDMEIALYFIKLLSAPRAIPGAEQEEKEIYIRQANRVILNLSNPFAIRLLRRELKRVKDSKYSYGASEISGVENE